MKDLKKRLKKANKGFSLVELIIVIAIMAILAGVLAPQFIKHINNSKKSSDIQNAQMIYDALSSAISEQEAGTLSLPAGVTINTSNTETEFTGTLAAALNMGNAAPAVKVDKNYKFYYKINKTIVEVYAYKSNTDKYLLAPSVDATSGCPWSN